MDVTWIPGDADAVVLGAVGAAALIGGLLAAARSRRAGGAEREPVPGTPVEPSGADAAVVPGEPPARDVSAPTLDVPEPVASRLAARSARVGGALGQRLAGFFGRRDLGQDAWDELEEALLLADVGAAVTDELIASVKTHLRDAEATPRDALRAALIEAIDPSLDRSLDLGTPGGGVLAPVLVVGVNGVGKTTSVGKIARVLVAEGYDVVLGAADTFRAAAADQLETWGARVGVRTIRADVEGADPASVAFDATRAASEAGADVVLIDTAGRLQNKAGLMDQLGKISRVVAKVTPAREALLVLDATTGQNGLTQARVFAEAVPLTGIVLTKMDGTAKGGIVLAVQRELGVPVKFVGLGEGADDLAPFVTEDFVDGLLGKFS